MPHNYPKLLSPARIGGLELRNRVVMAAMGTNYATADGYCSEQLMAYYEARAAGGVGLIVLETSAALFPAGASMPNTIAFSSDEFLPGLSRAGCEGPPPRREDRRPAQPQRQDGPGGYRRRAAHSGSLEEAPARSDMFGTDPHGSRHFHQGSGPDGKAAILRDDRAADCRHRRRLLPMPPPGPARRL